MLPERTRVSVVIPCFNHARFLSAAIDSVLAQNWPDLDVIVVDDGSSDGSGDVAARYDQVWVVRQSNMGLSHARNAGLRAALGDVVMFLDADDRLVPGALRHAVDALHRRPDAAMVFGACRLIDEHGKPLPTTIHRVDSHFYEQLLRRNYIWMPAMAAFRRSVFATVGEFDPLVDESADYDMYLRVARAFPIVRSDAVFAEYRQHGANMSADPVRMLRATLKVVRRHVPAAGPDAFRSWRTFYGEQLVERFRRALRSGHGLSAALDACRLLRWYPEGVRRHLWKKLMLAVQSRPPRSTPPAPVPPSSLAGGG